MSLPYHAPRERERAHALKQAWLRWTAANKFTTSIETQEIDPEIVTPKPKQKKKRPSQNDNKSTKRCLESRFCAPNETLEWDKSKLQTNKLQNTASVLVSTLGWWAATNRTRTFSGMKARARIFTLILNKTILIHMISHKSWSLANVYGHNSDLLCWIIIS